MRSVKDLIWLCIIAFLIINIVKTNSHQLPYNYLGNKIEQQYKITNIKDGSSDETASIPELIFCVWCISYIFFFYINDTLERKSFKIKVFFSVKTIKSRAQLARCELDNGTHVRYDEYITDLVSANSGGMRTWIILNGMSVKNKLLCY